MSHFVIILNSRLASQLVCFVTTDIYISSEVWHSLQTLASPKRDKIPAE